MPLFAVLPFLLPVRPLPAKIPALRHWGGDLVSLKTGEKSSAELTLDHYGCYALSIKRDPGIETGFYTVQDGKVVLKTTNGAKRLTFIVEGERLKAEPTPDQPLPKDCCELERR